MCAAVNEDDGKIYIGACVIKKTIKTKLIFLSRAVNLIYISLIEIFDKTIKVTCKRSLC